MKPICLLGLAGLVSLPAIAHAQPDDSSPFVIDRNRPDRLPTISAPTGARPTVDQTAPIKIDAEATTAPIVGISFGGAQVPKRVAEAARLFVGQPASRSTLEALAHAMSKAYARANIALYTVAIPQQDLRAGQVRVLVAEGFIESVVITGEVEGRRLALIKAYAEALRRERPLSRLTLERYLSLVRDIPGVKLDAQLLAGTTPGAVRLVLKLDFKGHDIAFGFDNRTTSLFDDGQFTASAKFYSALQEGDQTDLVTAAAANLREYQYFGLSHSTPLDADGTRLSVSGGYLRTRPMRSVIDGNAKTLGIGVSHSVIRSYNRNLVASLGLDGLNSDNAAFGSLIALERTRALRLAIGYSDARAKRTVYAGATVSRGLDIAGARVIRPFAETTYTKANMRATVDQAIGKRVIARLRMTAQYSQDRLPAAERFAVGGVDFGRGFDTAILNADRGLAGLAELAWRPMKTKVLSPTELYTFIDGATVQVNSRGAVPTRSFSLASAGAGVRLAYREKGAISIEAARSIEQPFVGAAQGWNISVGWRLSMGRS